VRSQLQSCKLFYNFPETIATSKNNKEREDAKKVAKEVNHILGL
jgi:hypothetical protein